MVHQLKPTNNLYAIRVPADAGEYFINNVGCIRYSFNKGRESTCIEPEQLGFYVESGNCEILGDVTKDEFSFDALKEARQKGFDGMTRDFAEKSFRVILSENALYFENPLGKEFNCNEYNGAGGTFKGELYTMSQAEKKWQELQDNLVTGKLLIIRKLEDKPQAETVPLEEVEELQEPVDPLLIPRIIVTGNYPDTPYKIGQVLTKDGNRNSFLLLRRNIRDEFGEPAVEEVMFPFHSFCSNFPLLFKPLIWWKHRKPEEMPRYVKVKCAVYKIERWEPNGLGWILHHVNIPYKPELTMNVKLDWHFHSDKFLPATEEEYNYFIK